jgi:hypothetical protein
MIKKIRVHYQEVSNRSEMTKLDQMRQARDEEISQVHIFLMGF